MRNYFSFSILKQFFLSRSSLFFILLFLFCFSLIFTPTCSAAQNITKINQWGKSYPKYKNIKKSSIAGTFYPQDKQKLNDFIDGLLNAQEDYINNEHICAMIVPHAGYIYSGPVAAKGYQAIRHTKYKTIIILAPTHYYNLNSAAVFSQEGFQTPLGQIRIDQDFVSKLISSNSGLFQDNPAAFEKEHSIEVQLPFLQKTQSDFKIVPIIIPTISYAFTQSIAQALTSAIGQRQDILLIASTDLSHYHDQVEAKKIDGLSINLILNSRSLELFNCVHKAQAELCGSAAVITLIQIMENLKAGNIQLLKYATSADSNFISNPDITRVVGYASIIFTKPANKNTINQRSKKMLNDTQKKDLLNIARQSIVNIVKNKQKRIVLTDDPVLMEHRGAFVTIYEDNSLRGCIGLIEADQPLIDVVTDMAIQASTKDPRFMPISEQELDIISLEISVMSPIKQISDINQIEVGKHGLIIRKGYNSGLLLPQVATEYHWNTQQFLEQTCVKAGLNKDAWKQNAQIFIFSAEVFGEEELR